jgi:hypothetical protein
VQHVSVLRHACVPRDTNGHKRLPMLNKLSAFSFSLQNLHDLLYFFHTNYDG